VISQTAKTNLLNRTFLKSCC